MTNTTHHVSNHRVVINDAARPWLVIENRRNMVVARYATKAQAIRRLRAILTVGL